MFVKTLHLRQFRCFESFQLSFSTPVTIIEGPNGSGKTSLIEALYYACYLRSFRTHLPRELALWKTEGFSLVLTGDGGDGGDGASLDEALAKTGGDGGNGGEEWRKPAIAQSSFEDITSASDGWDLKVMVSGSKRTVKANNVAIASYKELFDYYRIIAFNAQDMELVSGSPEERRQFIDHAILLTNPSYIQSLRSFRKILKQRNALLANSTSYKSGQLEYYSIWTERLQKATTEIRIERETYLAALEKELQRLVVENLKPNAPSVTLKYKAVDEGSVTIEREIYTRRSLIGAHLDEIEILFNQQSARRFASRGQLKLIVYFLKLAQLSLLNKPTVVVVDDFITDFDEQRSEQLIELLCSHGNQVIFTVPSGSDLNQRMNNNYQTSTIRLT